MAKTHPQGRRTKLTPDVQTKITNSLAAGNYFDVSCEYAGINAASGYAWMARGRKELQRREGFGERALLLIEVLVIAALDTLICHFVL